MKEMKIRLAAFALCVLCGVPLWAQLYKGMWKEVETYDRKDMPASVAKSAHAIYLKAKAERNAPQMMKAYLKMLEARCQIAPDSLVTDLSCLKEWAETEPDSVNAAVLYSIVGELYARSNLREEAMDYLLRSVEPKESLENCSAQKYVPLVVRGETSQRYEDDRMYPLLVRRAIKTMERYCLRPSSDADIKIKIGNLSSSLAAYFERRNEIEAYLLWLLECTSGSSSVPLETREEICRDWIKKYGTAETCAEVYKRLAGLLRARSRYEEAYDTLRAGIERYAKYGRVNELKNELLKLTEPSLAVEMGEWLYPGQEGTLQVKHRNLSGFDLKIYRTECDDMVGMATYEKDLENAFWKEKWTLLRTEHYDLDSRVYAKKDTLLSWKIPEEGCYLIEAIPLAKSRKKSLSQRKVVYVSALGVIKSHCFENKVRGIVMDRMTGKPVQGAEVYLYTYEKGKYVPTDTIPAESNGMFSYDWNGKGSGRITMRAVAPNHPCMPLVNRSDYHTGSPSVERSERVSLFTDRTLYRPGQTVYVSGIVFAQEGDSLYASADRSVDVDLRDVNHKIIGFEELRTNEFGSFHARFTLPSVCLPGTFRLNVEAGNRTTGSLAIKVEEYKRPSFEVEWTTPATAYCYGDTVWISGKAAMFTGMPVQDAEVTYRVGLKPLLRLSSEKIVAQSGTVRTDSAGVFSFPLVTGGRNGENTLGGSAVWYAYTVDVLSQSGDKQSRSGTLRVDDNACALRCETKGNDWIKEKPGQLTLSVKNGNGKALQRMVEYEVAELLSVGEKKPVAGTVVYKAVARGNEAFVPKEVYALSSGNYRLRAYLRENGKVYVDSTDIALFSIEDKSLPAGKDLFVYTQAREEGEEETKIFVGTSRKDVYLFCNLYVSGRLSHAFCLPLSDTLFVLPTKIDGRNVEAVSVAYVKDNVMRQRFVAMPKLEPDKKLAAKWIVFRDKLQAGGKEEWRLRVTNPQGKPVRSELLATLYDISLDRLSSRNKWNIALFRWNMFPYIYNDWLAANGCSFNMSFPYDLLDYDDLDYTYIGILKNVWNLSTYRETKMTRQRKKETAVSVSIKDGSMNAKAEAAVPVTRQETVMVGSVTHAAENEEVYCVREADADSGMSEDWEDEFVPRQNFAETAFFYPQLRTNEQGETDIVFTLPESLTTWRFMGLAHTKEMDFVVVDTTAVARKEFMLQTRLPRFVRIGDLTSFAATLSNFSDKKIVGTVRMELFDPLTEKVFHAAKRAFRVEAGRTVPVSFAFRIPDTYRVMACRMVADGGMFSDGEQCFLPVLDNKEVVTESVTVTLTKAGEKQVDLESLFNNQSPTASDRHLTVEFTGNPSWLAVMALPVMGRPSDKDAYSLAAAYYSVSLASWIVEQNPPIRTLFEVWKAQGGKETFWSELERNADLKELVLECSPFLQDAENETEQRHRLAMLFDLNDLQNRQALYLDRLRALQTEEGGWSWYEGMDTNLYMTVAVIEALLRLRALTGTDDASLLAMLEKGLAYLDKYVVDEYRSSQTLLIDPPRFFPEYILHYLYINALGERSLSREVQRACTYFFEMLKKERTLPLTIHGKAVVALLLAKNGEKKASDDMLKSLLEYSVYTPEMGRYYDTDIALSTWADYRIPTQVAVIEALKTLGGEEEIIMQMQQWLLKQKQVQCWDTPVNTVNAVYALLLDRTCLSADRPMPELWLDNKPVSTENASLGLNSVKETVALSAGEKAPRIFTVHKEDDGMAWGAVYAQYTERMDKMSDRSEGLSIARVLYVERMKEGKLQWVELEEGEALRVGDRVKSSLRLTADRSMDFVQMKEGRAACMEPEAVMSGYRWGQGLGYYAAVKDASMEYYMDRLPKGTYTIESFYRIALDGTYETGSVKVQSAYAPAFNAHTAGRTLQVVK